MTTSTGQRRRTSSESFSQMATEQAVLKRDFTDLRREVGEIHIDMKKIMERFESMGKINIATLSAAGVFLVTIISAVVAVGYHSVGQDLTNAITPFQVNQTWVMSREQKMEDTLDRVLDRTSRAEERLAADERAIALNWNKSHPGEVYPSLAPQINIQPRGD